MLLDDGSGTKVGLKSEHNGLFLGYQKGSGALRVVAKVDPVYWSISESGGTYKSVSIPLPASITNIFVSYLHAIQVVGARFQLLTSCRRVCWHASIDRQEDEPVHSRMYTGESREDHETCA